MQHSCRGSYLISGELAALKLKGELADRLRTGLSARLAQAREVWICTHGNNAILRLPASAEYSGVFPNLALSASMHQH